MTTPLHPLLGLALTHAVRFVDRRSVDILFFPSKGTRAKPPPHPKIDRGATGYDGLAYACGAAARRVVACFGSFQAWPRRGMWRGGHDPPSPPPARPRANARSALC